VLKVKEGSPIGHPVLACTEAITVRDGGRDHASFEEMGGSVPQMRLHSTP